MASNSSFAGDASRHGNVTRAHYSGGRAFAADTTSSWLAFVASLCVAHPLDTLRVRWQTLGQTPATTIRVDGVRSLYAGISGPTFGIGPLIAVIFSVNEHARATLQRGGWLRWDDGSRPGRPMASCGLSPMELFAAGCFAGAVVAVPMCPVSVVRTHQQNSARAGRRALSVPEVATDLWRNEGPRGLFRCLGLEVFATGVGRGVYFWAYEELKALFKPEGSPLRGSWTADWAAALGTSLVWWATMFPCDLIKTQLQAVPIAAAKRATHKLGKATALRCASIIVREHGLTGLYRGFHLTLARSLASSGTALPIYDALQPHLRAAF
eukprot:CAMPEP_0174882056 /NCGR_PEP_ID=MMETSP1114-20130205/84572_1 /TAXON_ID=312471 /ORGANISM="Neobodo designis, Strain CCAP 1951/1" /LENGTH=323 /DNA_ID=CAMNT_0016117453 /DNA_START=56 /DNA_END=1024 /DNA_ORIENTATION=-